MKLILFWISIKHQAVLMLWISASVNLFMRSEDLERHSSAWTMAIEPCISCTLGLGLWVKLVPKSVAERSDIGSAWNRSREAAKPLFAAAPSNTAVGYQVDIGQVPYGNTGQSKIYIKKRCWCLSDCRAWESPHSTQSLFLPALGLHSARGLDIITFHADFETVSSWHFRSATLSLLWLSSIIFLSKSLIYISWTIKKALRL